MKKVGILDLLANQKPAWWHEQLGLTEEKQYVAVTPQAIAVWCRQLGHRVHYATYYGAGDPREKLPDDLDIVFISAHSHLAPLAGALSRVYRKQGVRTALGGPHAKSFPHDALRYFDWVVVECDKTLISDLIAGHYDPHAIVSSLKPYDDVPTIQERLPEIRSSVFMRGRPYWLSMIPILASMGCPYTCNFCMDWNSRYRPLSTERLTQDLRFVSEHLPGVKLMFYDPNFGIRFDETLAVFDAIPPGQRNPYAFETSLTTLRRRERLERLRETNCLAVAPGIESWIDYNNKAGTGHATGRDKLDMVVEHLHTIHEYVPYVQANFILGLDGDRGTEPFELTQEFLLRTPFIYPTFNIPMAFGGTPLYYSLRQEGRILDAMPFTFYRVPYLTLILKNYDPITYFKNMVDLYALLVSPRLFRMRLADNVSLSIKFVNNARITGYRGVLASLRRTLHLLQTDSQFRAFHLGRTTVLPEFYVSEYQRQMGPYVEWMPLASSQPLLELQNEASYSPAGKGEPIHWQPT